MKRSRPPGDAIIPASLKEKKVSNASVTLGHLKSNLSGSEVGPSGVFLTPPQLTRGRSNVVTEPRR